MPTPKLLVAGVLVVAAAAGGAALLAAGSGTPDVTAEGTMASAPVATGPPTTLAPEPAQDDPPDAPPTLPTDPEPAYPRQPLGLPTVVRDGVAVYDLRLQDGERFRLSLPAALARDLTLFQPPAPAPVTIAGPAATISITFGFCEEQPRRVNALGSQIRMTDELVRFCRPDELVVVEVEPTVTLLAADTESFDLRPIQLGNRYGTVVTEVWPSLANCNNCAPWGPMVYDGVVVNLTGPTAITAVRADTLDVVWTVDTGGHNTYLHGGPGGVYAEVTGGPLLRLDPATGDEQWRIERHPDERDAGLSGHGDDLWLLRSSFHIEGDDRAPVLRRIDVASGSVLWTAHGRPGAEWQWDRPVTVGGVAVLMDVTNHPQVPVETKGGTLRAYDSENGDLLWTADLNSPTEAYDFGLLTVVDLETGPALIAATIDGDLVRVDPATGDLLWRTAVRGKIGGTDFAPNGSLAIDVTGPQGRFLIDPDTGEVVLDPAGPPPAGCTPLVGEAPWVVLFEPDPAVTCVVAEPHQNLQIWNKGFDRLRVTWLDRVRLLYPDESFDTGPIGAVLSPGPNMIEATPYPMPIIWVLDDEEG